MTHTNPAPPWQHRDALVNGVRLHYVEAGSGPLVVLLHGFPEFWYSWRRQIPALAAAGFRVIAPDMRGYNLSDKPPGVRNYRLPALVADVRGLITHAGASSAAVVGHDWGGVIAWALAIRHPEVVRRLVALNAPHPAAFQRELANPGQLLRSWYIFFFQLPVLPEWLAHFRNHALLERMLRTEPVRPAAFSDEDVERYKRALGQPGAPTGMVNYYRALVRFGDELNRPVRRITAPTLLIWGLRDRHLGVSLTHGLDRWVADLRVERLPNASHWVQNDAPDRVNGLLVDFLGR